MSLYPVIRLSAVAVALALLPACSNQSSQPAQDDAPGSAAQPGTAEPATAAAQPAVSASKAVPTTDAVNPSSRGTESSRPELIDVPGGTFSMGSADSEAGRYPNEGPRRRVAIAPFALCRTEVTQAQWQAVMGTSPSDCRHGCAPDLAVHQVSWLDAIEYLNRLSEREGKTKCYARAGDTVTWDRACTGYRLPTEAEWEYAARAGTNTPYSFAGSGAGALGEHAWYVENAGDQIHTVAGKAANAWGFFDMHGNSYEWVWDWFGPYPDNAGQAVTNPMGPDQGRLRVLRGGSFVSRERDLRSANRFGVVPTSRSLGLGLRCAQNANM